MNEEKILVRLQTLENFVMHKLNNTQKLIVASSIVILIFVMVVALTILKELI